jgi:RNA polymerase sigma-70 factor, ECF subfamily
MSDGFKNELVALMPRLRGYAMALTGSASEADDLVQDTLVRAWRFRDSFQDGSNLKAWVCKILRNTFYTGAVAKRNTVQDVEGKFAARLACDPDQEWRLQYSELMEALGALTQDARDSLLMVVAGGLSYEEAAEIAGCPVGTMKSRVNRAREHLAEMVQADFPKARKRAEKNARAESFGGREPAMCRPPLAAAASIA